MRAPAGRWGALALVAAMLAAALATGCGDDESQTTTQADVPSVAAPADDTTRGDTETEAPDEGEDAEGAGGDAAQGSAEGPAGSEGDQPTPEQVRDYAEQQEQLNEQIRQAAEAAQAGDEEQLERLREELMPSDEQREKLKRWLRERCAEPDPPPICARVEKGRGS